MSIENRSERLPQAEPFDAEWHDRLREFGSFDDFAYLEGDPVIRAQQRQKFEAGEVENPTLDYPKLKLDDLQQKEQGLLALKIDVIQHEPTSSFPAEKIEVVKQAYRWRINQKIAETRMLMAAATGDLRHFKRYSEFIYGRPAADIFAYSIRILHEQLLLHQDSENPDLVAAADELSKALPPDIEGPLVHHLPDAETQEFVQHTTRNELGHLISIPESQEFFDAPAIQQAFQIALEQAKADGWKVVVNPGSSTFNVIQSERTINIPASRTIDSKSLAELIVHEVGTHVIRRENGERSSLKLLGFGLDRYDHAEEGLATLQEQALGETLGDFGGLEGHLAISLAQGVDGHPRNFREVYDIMRQYFLVEAFTRGKKQEEAEAYAKEWAWRRCVRTFRGTDCKTRGIAFTKDIVYREGNIAMWEIAKTRPAEMQRIKMGKFDPSNLRHLWILFELGITDQELLNLEKEPLSPAE